MRVLVDIDQGVIQDPRVFARIARGLLDYSVMHNRVVMRLARSRGKALPSLYRSGVRYRPEPLIGRNVEEFASIRKVYQRGWGDCDDLVPIRVAELQELGERASVRLYWRRNPQSGDLTYHVQVRRGDGKIEDPSRFLGMM